MSTVTRISKQRNLSARRAVTLEIPEFFLCALEHRLAEANDGATPDEALTLDQLVEIDLANGLSLAEVAHLERDLPGISAAVSQWLEDTSS
jgi:hypothetical protein